MNKATAIVTLANNLADAEKLAEDHAVAMDNDWHAGATIYTFSDNSTLTISGPEYTAN